MLNNEEIKSVTLRNQVCSDYQVGQLADSS